MSKYLLVAINGPTQGGNIATRRFRVVWQNRIDKPYITISEFEAEYPAALMRELGEKAADFTDKMDRTTSVSLLAVEMND
jgi:hypothetical protein